ncbi:MAG TPA: efflux transporter outer membrane subunit [Methylovirgula sp.]|nr:efflux transporter outer membrane subunit [Methylovirgula sp.]
MLSGCAVGPDFVKPPPPPVNGYTRTGAGIDAGNQPKTHFIQDLDIPGQWWGIYHSAALNRLIEDAMAHNADLQAAQAALRVARENAAAQRGGFYPQLSGSFSGIGGDAGSEASSPLANNAPNYTLLTPQVAVSYTPDVFGLVRRENENLDALAEVQSYKLEATYLTLTSNVVTSAVQEAALRGQIKATKEIIKISQANLGVLRQQRDHGQIGPSDVLLQEAALAQVEQTLPPLERQLAQQRNLLTALAGRFPSDEIGETFTIASLHLPATLPVSLPSQLVEQRPDIKAAEANLHAASADVGVATALRLPLVSLTAGYGNAAERLATMFAPQTIAWQVGGSVTQPMFDGFSLYHKQKAAQAAFAQADAQYRSTVITAFQNVADVLRALEADARTYKAASAAETAAFKSLDITRKQLSAGQVSSIVLLNAQQTYLQASLVRVQAQAARLADTAALFQALGGGWWNRGDVSPQTVADGPKSVKDYFVPKPPDFRSDTPR